MIARIRESETTSAPPPALVHARRIVAAALLPTGDEKSRPPQPSRRWRAWGLAISGAIVAALYAAYLAGWL